MTRLLNARPSHTTKTEMIFQDLHSRINSGAYSAGKRLILRELAEEFGCSQIPVREAVNSLASLGLVVIVPHEGAHVAEVRLTELIEITEIRLILEREAT